VNARGTSVDLGRGLISAQPSPDGCKLDEGKVIGGKLIVARRDPATLLDAVEESFDPVAGEDPRPNENARRTALQLSLCSEPTFSGAPKIFLRKDPSRNL
jgi:hypothetical protein